MGFCEFDCFKSCLSDHSQYVSINGYDSVLAAVNSGVPQGSVLGPLLLLLLYKRPESSKKIWKVNHFAGDTNQLYLSNSIKNLNKLVNADLKRLVNWLNANKKFTQCKKTEMLIFKLKQKKFESDLKIKLSGEGLYPTENWYKTNILPTPKSTNNIFFYKASHGLTNHFHIFI